MEVLKLISLFVLILTLSSCGGNDSDVAALGSDGDITHRTNQSITAGCATTVDENTAYSCTASISSTAFWWLDDATTCSWIQADIRYPDFYGTPTPADVGSCDLVIGYVDNLASTTETFTITVVNIAPSLTIADTSIAENSPQTEIRTDADVQASDEGYGNYSFNHAITAAPKCVDVGTLSIDNENGAILYEPEINFAGTCNITVQFDDGHSVDNIVNASFQVSVSGVNDPPVMLCDCPAQVNQDQVYYCDPHAEDADLDILTWSTGINNTCSWASVNPLTGEVTGTPADSDVSNCILDLEVSDGTNTENFLSAIQVDNTPPTLSIADAQTNNTFPKTIRTDAQVQASEEGEGVYILDVANTPGEKCTDHATIMLDSATGQIDYNPTDGFIGYCNIRIIFDDGNASFNQVVAVFSVQIIESPNPVNNLATDPGIASLTDSPVITWDPPSTPPAFDYYEIALGTFAEGDDVVAWTNIGTATSYTFSSLMMSECDNYYVSVRVVSTTVGTSDVRTVSYIPDVTPPSVPSSLTLSTDRLFLPGIDGDDTNTLSWSAATDNCALNHYEAGLGSTSLSDDIISFSTIGLVTTHQFNAVSDGVLSVQTDYYNLLKAVDNAGNESSVVASGSWQYPKFTFNRELTLSSTTVISDHILKVELNTSNFDYTYVQNDCDDIQFFDTSGSPLKFYKESCDISGESVFYVQIPTTGTGVIEVHYANVTETDQSNPEAFNGTIPIDRYVRISAAGNNTLALYSYVDNNLTYVETSSGTATNLITSAYSGVTIASTTQDVIQTTGPVSGRVSANSNLYDTIAPLSWSDYDLAYPQSRYNETYSFYNPNSVTANITIYDYTTAGALVSTNPFTIPAYSFLNTATNTTVGIVESDIPVTGFVRGNSGDAVTLVKASTDIFGIPSGNGYITFLEDGTYGTIYWSNGTTSSISGDRGDRYTTGGTGSQMVGDGVRIITNKPIWGISQADGDGTDSTMFHPYEYLSNEYIIPTASEYIAILCAESTTVIWTDASGATIKGSQPCTASGNNPGKVYFRPSSGSAGIPAGDRINADKPIYALQEHNVDRESNMISIKDGIQYEEIPINEMIGAENYN